MQIGEPLKEIAAWNSGDYSWHEIRVYTRRNPADSFTQIAVDHQSGCSCEGYEPPTATVLEWTYSRAVFYQWLKSALDDAGDWSFNAAERAEIMAEARELVW